MQTPPTKLWWTDTQKRAACVNITWQLPETLWNPLLFFCVSVTMEMFALHLKGHNKKECKGSEALPWHTLLFSYKTSGPKYHLVWLLLSFFNQGFLIIHVKKMKRICWYVACVHVVGFSHTHRQKDGHLFTTSAYTETEIQQPHSCCLLRSILLHLCCVLYCFSMLMWTN